jgi:translocation and assembly module TamB
VTTGITENREIRSSIEWRIGRFILQGAYDNTNDVSTSPLGNLGADLRFRLEFE